MGWPSTLTYEQVVATTIARSVNILAHYGDVDAAAAAFAENPALADDPDALIGAAENGHDAFVRLMLQYQPDLARRIAVVARTRELTEFLFQQGMDPNRSNWLRITPLHRFAEQGDVEKAAIFMDHGADLHARDEELSSTPLAWAARSGKRTMVEFLLRRGAKPNLPDDPSWATPLSWATRRGHMEIVQILTEFEKHGTLPPPPTVQLYEMLAEDLVKAYQSGDEDATKRLGNHFGIQRLARRDQVRSEVRRRLGLTDDRNELALAEARQLIVRLHGFESWSQMLERNFD
jgi:hypothetical protein